MATLQVTRHDAARQLPDPRRVITKAFVPHDDVYADGTTRLGTLMGRIMAMDDRTVASVLADTRDTFTGRHADLDEILERGFDRVERLVTTATGATRASIGDDRRLLIGAYFTHEYSIEAAALSNPSMVLAPDQAGLAPGEARFVMSLRAIGEGHISSIEFRSGVVGPGASVRFDPLGTHTVTGERQPHELHRSLFVAKVRDLGMSNDVAAFVLGRVGSRFTMRELEAAIASLDDDGIERSISGETTRLLHWLASSNYRTSFPSTTRVSERVLFPSSPVESNGMEDARFVRFVDDDGEVTYFATYTAFDGHQILPQLLETHDFVDFRVTTLSGGAARNKGIALFPRRIDGRFMALGRQDNVDNFLMVSDDVRVWDDAVVVQQPSQPWELVQLGNAGSPIETEAGWLVVTHGVGPLRCYSLGAVLLDLDDPTRVLGHLREPLLSPDLDEREGYVPNVVYSCGSLVHDGHLVVPYGFSDVGAGVATVAVQELLDRMS